MSVPGGLDPQQERLNRLWRAYRQACGDPEPGANFMPDLWSRIEGRQTVFRRLRRVTQAFVTAAAALTIFLAGLTRTTPELRAPEVYQSTYLEVLVAHHAVEGETPAPTADEPGEIDLL